MSDVLNQVLALFKEKYSPASNVHEATDYLDTEEIFSSIERIAPNSGIKKDELFEALQNEGYRFAPEPNKFNFSLKWLLTRQ